MCNTSPWTNKWQDVYDFTAHRTAESGIPNWSINDSLNWTMIKPLGEVNEMVSKVKEFNPAIKGVQDITDSDLSQIHLEFDQERQAMPDLFDVGSYFNTNAGDIIKGVIPSA